MQTLERAVLRQDSVGRKLTLPWHHMNEHISLRTKELVMMAGAPGGGKSTVAVNMAMQMEVPMLYLAQDSPASVLSRMTALATSQETRKTFRAIADGSQRTVIAEEMADVRPTLVFERGAMLLEGIKERVEALQEWLGEFPSVVVVDNLIDMIIPGQTHGDNSFYTTALPYLKQMANEYNLTVLALHHVTRGGGRDNPHGRGRAGIALNDLLFAGEREARHVWGVFNDGNDHVFLQILKQQDGPADPDGNMKLSLRWYPKLGRLLSATP